MARLALVDHITTASHLHWGVAEIDALFRDLPEFMNLQIVCEDLVRREQLWNLIIRRVIPSADNGGLRCVSADAPTVPEAVAHFAERCQRDLVDVVFLRVRENDVSAVKMNFRDQDFAAAIVMISPEALPVKPTRMDMTLYFEGNTMLLSNADGRTRRKGSLKAEVLERVSGQPEPIKPKLCALGVTKEVAVTLGHAFGASHDLVSQVQEDSLPVAMIVGTAWNNVSVRDMVRKFSDRIPMLYLQGVAVRTEDRVEIYRSGVKSILPSGAVADEIVAALHALMPAGSHHSDPFRALDADFARLSEGARKQSYWSMEEADAAIQHFAPFVANRLARAALAGHCAGAVVVPLPAPASSPDAATAALLERTLIGNTLAQLRASDVSFVINRRIVIVSYQMSALSAQAIFKRYANLMHELQHRHQAQPPKIVRSCVPTTGKELDEAKRFLQEIIKLTV